MPASARRPGLPTLLLVLLLALPALAGPADQARTAATAKRWEDAAVAWQEVLAKDPRNEEAALGLARAAIEGALPDARRAAEEALLAVLERKADNLPVRVALGEIYLAMAGASPDEQEKKFIYEDAVAQFETAVKQHADDEGANVGLARAAYETARFEDALGILDAFLGRAKSKGPALYWKGQVLYLLATDAYRQSGSIEGETRRLFEEARGAYDAAAAANPDDFPTWMQAAYAAQYLGERDAARAAYEKAMDIDPDSDLPLRGIEAIFGYDPALYVQVLDELVAAHPKNASVLFYRGYQHLARGEHAAAAKDFRAYTERARDPAGVWTWLGQALLGQGQRDEAAKAFAKGLTANPDDQNAAGAWDQMIRDELGAAALQSPDAALRFADAYGKLLALAPNDPWIRNNLAFQLREAVDRSRGGQNGGPVPAAWRRVLERCVAAYVDAAARVEAALATPAYANPDWATRHAFAGILNDTGLMYQYYPSMLDLEKAEGYYDRALEVSEDGHLDAFGNLEKILAQAGRWEDLHALASACAEGLRDAAGNEDATGRARARGLRDRLEREHPELGGD